MNKTDEILDRLRGQQPVIDNPEELTDLIMSSLPERNHPGRIGEAKLRLLTLPLKGMAGGLVAAGIALLIALHYNNKVEPEQQPVVAEVVEPESPQTVPKPAPEPVIEEKQEPQAPQPAAQPVRPKKRVKTQEPAEEPLLAEAEPVEEAPVEMICQDVLGNTRESSCTYATQAQEIRQRGEQVTQYVAMLNQQIKAEQQYVEY